MRGRWMTLVFLVSFVAVGRADPRLIQALASDPSPKVRAQAALGLTLQPATPDVTAALVRALNDEAAIVRGSAAKVLGSVGTDDTFVPLCRAARDPDQFVSKWARWAAARVAARTSMIVFTVRDIQVEAQHRPGVSKTYSRLLAEDMTRNLQEGVLQVLLESGGFDVQAGMDFSAEVEGATAVATGQGQGDPKVRIAVRGRLVRMTSDDHRAEVEVRLEAVGPFGVVLWEVQVRGVGMSEEQPAPPKDEYVDEFTIPTEQVDTRVLAAQDAGRAAGRELVRALRSEHDERP